jgi:hydroxyethylthiazole kinase
MSSDFDLEAALERMRKARPLVHNITNDVVMNVTANALLAAGASPAMVHAPEEAAEFVRVASALVVNIGTLTAGQLAAMLAATAAARDLGLGAAVPWVLDPVAVGATRFRRDAVTRLLAERPTVIRGNASEILAVATGVKAGRGVDADGASADMAGVAASLARSTGAVVAVTGVIARAHHRLWVHGHGAGRGLPRRWPRRARRRRRWPRAHRSRRRARREGRSRTGSLPGSLPRRARLDHPQGARR